jgi:polyphosphate kinase
MVVRQEGGRLRRYVHFGTGNYNPATALVYTDLGLFTADETMANDATALFNLLTGYSQGHDWRKLVVAPKRLQLRTLELIYEQIERVRNGQPAAIFAKFNSLVDPETIQALYRASQAGVPIDLVVRGICCLRPQLPGISDNIRVRSIVDRFLEHSRIYVFGEGDEARVYLSSADWMPRNFRRRVEAMFPVEAADLREHILCDIVPVYLRDNTRARILQSDGSYVRLHPGEGEVPHRAQEELAAAPPAEQPTSGVAESNGAHAAGQAVATPQRLATQHTF